MIRALPLLLGVAVLAGCGGDEGDANLILRETAAKLGQIKSAKPLYVKVVVDPRSGDEFGFELEGPVGLCDGRPLPRIDVEYTQFAQGEEATVQLISTGDDAFIEIGETAYELPDEQEAELRGACGELATGGLSELRVDDWVVDADADGENKVEGELDVVAVVNDLADVARAFGGAPLSRLDRDDAQRLAEAIQESRFELERGDDGLLRRLLLEADVAFDVAEELRRALGEIVGARITFELEVDDPNTEVEISAPENPRPSNELPGG